MDKNKMNLFQRILHAFKGLLRSIWKKIEPDPILTPLQQDIFDSFELYLYDDDNIRYLEPGSERKYIVSKNYVVNRSLDELFIMMDSRKITFIDKRNKHDFDNRFDMHEKTIKKMNEMFNEKVKQDRKEMRDDIDKNIKDSIEIILNKLKKKRDEKIQ